MAVQWCMHLVTTAALLWTLSGSKRTCPGSAAPSRQLRTRKSQNARPPRRHPSSPLTSCSINSPDAAWAPSSMPANPHVGLSSANTP